jgi:hypothetical protein
LHQVSRFAAHLTMSKLGLHLISWNNSGPILDFIAKAKPRVIPSSLLMRELGRMADAGGLPAVANRYALFSDGGHLSKAGMYAVAVLVCAMLYNELHTTMPIIGRCPAAISAFISATLRFATDTDTMFLLNSAGPKVAVGGFAASAATVSIYG